MPHESIADSSPLWGPPPFKVCILRLRRFRGFVFAFASSMSCKCFCGLTFCNMKIVLRSFTSKLIQFIAVRCKLNKKVSFLYLRYASYGGLNV